MTLGSKILFRKRFAFIEDVPLNIIKLSILTHLFPMYPFSTP